MLKLFTGATSTEYSVFGSRFEIVVSLVAPP